MLHFDPLFTASRICAAHGDAQRAKAFMALASRVRIACLGKDGSARAEELEMLEEHPERHYLAGISRKWDTVNKAAPGAAGSPVFEVWLWERAGEESLAEDMEMHDGIGVMVRYDSSLSLKSYMFVISTERLDPSKCLCFFPHCVPTRSFLPSFRHESKPTRNTIRNETNSIG